MDYKVYKAPYGQTVMIVTGLTGVMTIAFLFFGLDDSPRLIPMVLLPIIMLISFLFSPRSYYIADGQLNIVRPIGKKSIQIGDIKSVTSVTRSDMSGALRTFGVGGLFGMYGKFYSRKYGNMTWYVTQHRNLILIKTNTEKKIVISPDSPQLLDELKAVTFQTKL